MKGADACKTQSLELARDYSDSKVKQPARSFDIFIRYVYYDPMTDSTKTGGLFTSLVFFALVLTLAAVLLSAYLRLESIGLGCEDWPGCYGQLPETPDHGLVPGTAAGTLHRLTASLLGLIVVAITFLALRGRRPNGVGLTAPLLVFALTVFLSVLGYSTPSPDIPAVTLGNLLGGMTMLALLWWVGQRSVETIESSAAVKLRPWARLGLLVVAVQLALGAMTSAMFAGPACNVFPGCNGDWASITNLIHGFDLFGKLATDEQGRIVTGGVQKTIHMVHRLGALFTFLYLGWVALRALGQDSSLKNTAVSIIVFLVVQVVLGVTAVLADFPLWLVTAHNAMAAMLLLAVINLNHLVTPTGNLTQ